MTRTEWEAVFAAKELLHLGEKATLGEIKRSYRKHCKAVHPDVADNSDRSGDEKMQGLTEAYDLLMRYAEQYRLPLMPDDVEAMDADDWWLDRFGQDPLWGKGGK